MRITNCHTHTFTDAHIPARYPHWALMPFKRAPGLVKGLAFAARLMGQEGAAASLRPLPHLRHRRWIFCLRWRASAMA
ncbi:MAG TPA: hypothetical protein PLZ11_16090 [Thauera sp.]|nr:hypothetical protein [Thauera sp.]